MSRFPKEFYLVTGMATLFSIVAAFSAPFFSLYVHDLGASKLEVGLVVSLLSYVTILTSIPLGTVADRQGGWWVMPLAFAGLPISYVSYSFASSPSQVYPIRVFQAVALAAVQPALLSLVSSLSPQGRRGEGIGIYLTSAGLSMMAGPLLSGLLLSYFDYRASFQLAATIPLAIFAIYLALLKRGTLGRYFSRKNQQSSKSEDFVQSLKSIVSARPVHILTYIRLTFAFANAIVTTVYAIYVVEMLGMSPSSWAFIFSLKGVSDTLSRVPSGRLSDRFGRRRPLLMSFSMLAAVFLLLSMTDDLVLIVAAMVLYGIAHATRAVSEWAFLGDVIPRERISLANAYFNTVFELGNALGSTFAGVVASFLPVTSIMQVSAALLSSSVGVVAFSRVFKKESKPLP